jgi:hypothetical protein
MVNRSCCKNELGGEEVKRWEVKKVRRLQTGYFGYAARLNRAFNAIVVAHFITAI